MSTFIAFLRTGADGHCRVEFPDLPGCTAEAPHVAQAAALAGDELIRYLTVLASLGEPAPPPTPEAVLAEDARRGSATLMAFDVDLALLSVAHPLLYHTL